MRKTLPRLYIENSSGKLESGFPVKINGIQHATSQNGSVSLQSLVGKRVAEIEVNGSLKKINPPLLIQKNTQLRFRNLMGRVVSHRFTDETEYSTSSDNTLPPHHEGSPV